MKNEEKTHPHPSQNFLASVCVVQKRRGDVSDDDCFSSSVRCPLCLALLALFLSLSEPSLPMMVAK